MLLLVSACSSVLWMCSSPGLHTSVDSILPNSDRTDTITTSTHNYAISFIMGCVLYHYRSLENYLTSTWIPLCHLIHSFIIASLSHLVAAAYTERICEEITAFPIWSLSATTLSSAQKCTCAAQKCILLQFQTSHTHTHTQYFMMHDAVKGKGAFLFSHVVIFLQSSVHLRPIKSF